jgi:ATP-binding cassette subfamily B protein
MVLEVVVGYLVYVVAGLAREALTASVTARTIANLRRRMHRQRHRVPLLRLRQPTAGRITIDGQDLRQLTEASLREHVGVVFQDPFLIDASVAENIRLGRPDATQDEVEWAARLAQVHDAIVGLPLGYATPVGPVGERGSRLSGGQRQRIALARTMLRDPAILLLDEATSSLDPATEADFNRTLRGFARGRTVISVTHRLASVQDADEIFVVADGRLVERGTHQQLLARRGAYYALCLRESSPARPSPVSPGR